MQDLNSDHCPVELTRQNLIKTVWKEFEEILRNYSPLCEILNENIDAVLEDLSAAVKEALKASRLEFKCAEQTILPVATEHYLAYLGEKQTTEQVF